jgi:UDP-glucuronate 4-epimerase
MKILITGVAGFIGFHLANNLLNRKNQYIYGIDNLNDYYDINLKKERLSILKKKNKFFFKKIDITDKKKLFLYIKKIKPKIIINLAAQAGVRYSIQNPETYLYNNIIGFYNILEISREIKIKHLIFASTSSVYGASTKFPLHENIQTDKPLSFYAATKKSNEIMAHSYSNIYKLPVTGVRFFTVYGPYGRPDMSLFKFSKSIILGKKINLFNNGKHVRDFTYIDDVVEAIIKLIPNIPKNKIPYEIYNIGNGNPKKLSEFLNLIEKYLSKKSKIKNMPLQKGDVVKTHADIKKLQKKINYSPKTNIDVGIKNFVNWIKKRV